VPHRDLVTCAFIREPPKSGPTAGPLSGGTTVAIVGTNFVGSVSVSFGGIPAASVSVISAMHVIAVDRAGSPGTVDVSVTAAGGSSTSSPTTLFTYLRPPTVTAVSPGIGPQHGGTAIVISGSDFAAPATVHFGSVAASRVVVVSPTMITATAPAGTGTVNVTVTTPGGTSGLSSADLYEHLARPVVTQVSPSSGPLAGGTLITITGTSFAGSVTVTFGNAPATDVVVDSPTTITATSPAGTGSVQVEVTTVGGTSAPSVASRFTYRVLPSVTKVTPAAGAAAARAVSATDRRRSAVHPGGR